MATKHWKHALALIIAGSLLIGCSDDDNDDDGGGADQDFARVQDSRSFTVDEDALAFEAAEGTSVEADRWTGVIDGAGYRVEVPDNWNGMLVMYAHGYRGEGDVLTVSNPDIRQYYIENGYAWAASSYSTNFYDVRTGVEDTNALALAFTEIAADNGRTLDTPSKIYITGHSMGGHVTAAAIETEPYATANNVVEYAGAVPKCGVLGGELEFDYLLSFTLAAQEVAGMGATTFPATDFDIAAINEVLWNQPPPTFGELASGEAQPADPTDEGLILQGIVRDLSGGERPAFVQGFQGPYYYVVMGTGGRDGTINGILAEDLTSNVGFTYQIDTDPALSAEERAFNNSILRVMADPGANALRDDGLRWIPRINGQFSVPVVSLHNLGDLYVPFVHEQAYRRRAEANGSDYWLVQRAIRSSPHCDFTQEEQIEAFADMIAWEQNGTKPEGDNVLDPEVVASDDYGCEFTTEKRANIAACPADG